MALIISAFVKHLTSQCHLLDKQYAFRLTRLIADVLPVIAEIICQGLYKNGESSAVALDTSKAFGWYCSQIERLFVYEFFIWFNLSTRERKIVLNANIPRSFYINADSHQSFVVGSTLLIDSINVLSDDINSRLWIYWWQLYLFLSLISSIQSNLQLFLKFNYDSVVNWGKTLRSNSNTSQTKLLSYNRRKEHFFCFLLLWLMLTSRRIIYYVVTTNRFPSTWNRMIILINLLAACS